MTRELITEITDALARFERRCDVVLKLQTPAAQAATTTKEAHDGR